MIAPMKGTPTASRRYGRHTVNCCFCLELWSVPYLRIALPTLRPAMRQPCVDRLARVVRKGMKDLEAIFGMASVRR